MKQRHRFKSLMSPTRRFNVSPLRVVTLLIVLIIIPSSLFLWHVVRNPPDAVERHLADHHLPKDNRPTAPPNAASERTILESASSQNPKRSQLDALRTPWQQRGARKTPPAALASGDSDSAGGAKGGRPEGHPRPRKAIAPAELRDGIGAWERAKFAEDARGYLTLASGHADFIVEAVTVASRVQDIGTREDHSDAWDVNFAIFTDTAAFESYVARMERAESMVWPFTFVYFFDKHRDEMPTIEKSSFGSPCESCFLARKALPHVIKAKGSPADKWVKKIHAFSSTPFGVSAMIDTDVYVCSSTSRHFDAVENDVSPPGILITDDRQNGGGGDVETTFDVPSFFTERNTGIVFYLSPSRHPAMRLFFDTYRDFYFKILSKSFAGHDQPAFRAALHNLTASGSLHEIRLPRNVHCRGIWPLKSMEALKSLECDFVHGDNHTRARRKYHLPCKGDSLDKAAALVPWLPGKKTE